MSAARPSWRAVAEQLAERLSVHAFCDSHPPARADPDCPFCRDRAAYLRYVAAGGRDFTPDFSGEPIGIHEIAHRPAVDLGVLDLEAK